MLKYEQKYRTLNHCLDFLSHKNFNYNIFVTHTIRITVFSESLTEAHEINLKTKILWSFFLKRLFSNDPFPFFTNFYCFKHRFKTQCVFMFLSIDYNKVLTLCLMTNRCVMNWVVLPFVILLVLTSTLCNYYWWLLTLFKPFLFLPFSLLEKTLCKNTVGTSDFNTNLYLNALVMYSWYFLFK